MARRVARGAPGGTDAARARSVPARRRGIGRLREPGDKGCTRRPGALTEGEIPVRGVGIRVRGVTTG
ncbi:hypothetical protein MTP06_42270 [Streptomyces sp. PLM4]|uniref:Uncharacterized protein n=1 Tax=Streptomyces albidoflavus TaxID=1886 RepID=A0AA37FC32_9ACTN|nr:hypothetical protein MTP02_18050 [Streptomyces albus]BDH70778.1 hypothetical protein MTP06_42270 [Streptomyces sp. PLM4]GHI45932.1 hypothetical protein ScoT_21060 [Streptomyces albidoflavus]